ncbi:MULTISPECIES: transglycosylase domain-containing protein [Myroides]|uniref:Transglycosylase n=1 Tax=Myroides indicus TaxID=1323422 RepID=A0A4R7F6I1_9FLAO|nr:MULTISPECIES: transglycosylase domain-containing protein [Myroides]APA93463.1 hypothetical protein BK054_14755 [Myroides sp. ZB35]MDM1035331.1 penicillin-binding protein [Myroides odoratimimus]MDM1460448.1 penicillin-binding protein [Myroides odoratimimus]TDS64390.1 transglycosylase [Myroides indicus]
MNNEIDGFVIYNKSGKKQKAFAVVSEDYECNAKSSNLPSLFKEFIVPIEDKRFFEHNGIDYRGISRAMIRNLINLKVLEGGSTISQQLARNILRDNSRTIYRKIKESFKALNLENNFSKDEILNLYFDNVYFGKNLRGVRTASIFYFDKELEHLNKSEVLYLITILRGPNYYIKNTDKALIRMKILSNLLYQNRTININQFRKINRHPLHFNENKLFSIKKNVIPYITESINFKKKKIVSTLIPKFQNFAKQIVSDSKYPLSVIIIKNGKLVGFSSHYGSDYPFVFKSNVGSTLKPFLYYLAKKTGITNDEKFDAYHNSLNWDVREASYTDKFLNIDEALFHSNNNSFINISNRIGIDKSLAFLSTLLSIPSNELFSSTILGATKYGISLYQLALHYNVFFTNDIDSEKRMLMEVLNKIFTSKTDIQIENVFLKTGTTNNNDERIAVFHEADTTYAFLRNENPENDYSKEGNFIQSISNKIIAFFKPNKEYKWMS